MQAVGGGRIDKQPQQLAYRYAVDDAQREELVHARNGLLVFDLNQARVRNGEVLVVPFVSDELAPRRYVACRQAELHAESAEAFSRFAGLLGNGQHDGLPVLDRKSVV